MDYLVKIRSVQTPLNGQFSIGANTHALALIRNQYFMGTVDANAIATAALFHDVSEVLTGDLPTPIKYFSNSLTTAYRQIEAIACTELINTLPDVSGDERTRKTGGHRRRNKIEYSGQ